MKRTIITLATGLALAAPIAYASSSTNSTGSNEAGTAPAMSPAAGTSIEARIADKLAAQGFELRRVKPEDGLYEAYAMKDGQKYEIYFDAELNILRTKTND